VALRLEAQKPGQKKGPGQVGGVGDQEDAPGKVGFEEEEVLVGGLALGFAEEGLPGYAFAPQVAAAHLSLAVLVPREPAPCYRHPGGQALAVEDEGGLEAPF